MQTAQGIDSVNRNDDFGIRDDHEGRMNVLSRIPSRIVEKTLENVKTVARDLPSQLRKSPAAAIGAGVGLVGVALAAIALPLVLAPKRPKNAFERFVGRKNIKRAKKQLRALGLF